MSLDEATKTLFHGYPKKRVKMLEYFFESFFVILLLVLLLVTLSFIFFPDFNILTRGFCDLREVREINGESTLISFILFQTAIFLLFFSLLAFFLVLVTFFQGRKLTRYLSWIGTFFGVAQCPLNLIIFLERGTFEFHMIFVITGPLFLNIAVILYTVIFFIDKRPPKISKYSFLVLSIVAIIFAILEGVAASVGGTFNARFDRLGNTLFQYFLVASFILQGIIFFLMSKNAKEKMILINYNNKVI